MCVAMYEFQDALNAMNEAVKLTASIEFVFYKRIYTSRTRRIP